MAVKASASVTLSVVVDVKATYRYYLLQSSTLAKPSTPTAYPPASSWSDTEPPYSSGSTNSLYFVDCTVFCDDTFAYSAVSLSSSYEAAKEAYNKATNAQDTADKANQAIEDTTKELHETIVEQNTTLTNTCSTIIMDALKVYTQTGDFEAFKATTEAALELQAEQLSIKFEETLQEIKTVDADLQEKYNKITKHFTFDIDGLTIGQQGSPFKAVQDNDLYVMYVNNVPTITLNPDGRSAIPTLSVQNTFELLGYLFEKDANGNVNCGYVGGD